MKPADIFIIAYAEEKYSRISLGMILEMAGYTVFSEGDPARIPEILKQIKKSGKKLDLLIVDAINPETCIEVIENIPAKTRLNAVIITDRPDQNIINRLEKTAHVEFISSDFTPLEFYIKINRIALNHRK